MGDKRPAVSIPAPHYRISKRLWLKVILAAVRLQSRSFAADARTAATGMSPKPVFHGLENIPKDGPCLAASNHYTRPGLDAWWATLLISLAVAAQRDTSADKEIHWITTAAWTFPGSNWRRKYLTPLTRWAFARVAQVYGFITMPPMPPTPEEIYDRVVAVRRALQLAREIAPPGGMIGLAPEGRDTLEVVGSVPDGVGNFIAHLSKAGLPVLPVCVFEHQGQLHVSFGPAFSPDVSAKKALLDKAVANQVMAAISTAMAIAMGEDFTG